MRLWLTAGVLLFGVILSCGTEHHKSKRQVYQPRQGIRQRPLVVTTARPVPTPPPEYTDEEEEEDSEEPEPPTPAPRAVSYVRRPYQAPAPQERQTPVNSFRNAPGTGIRNRPQVEVTSETYEDDSNDYEAPTPAPAPVRTTASSVQRKPPTPFVPDPNNEDPDNGGYFRSVPQSNPTTPAPTVGTTARPQSPVRRPGPGQGVRGAPNRSLRGPSYKVADAPVSKALEADVLSKVLGGAPPVTPASARKPQPTRSSFRRGSQRSSSTTTTTQAPDTEEDEDEENEEPVAPPPPPIRKVAVQSRPTQASRRQRPSGSRTIGRPADRPSNEDVEKPLTPPPRRSAGNTRIRAPKPIVVLERPRYDDDSDDEEEEPSIRRQVTQRPPKYSTTTARPASRFGNSQKQDNGTSKFRGRFRPKAVVTEEEDEDDDESYEVVRRRGSKDRNRGRGRYQEPEDDDYEYDDYEEAPRRNNNRNRGGNRGGSRGGNRQRPRNRKQGKFGRGPTTSPRPSTRRPPADLEVRSDGRIIDFLGDPNFPRELSGHNLVDYPFYITVPEDIVFDCDERHDGFYASIPHFCQVFHYCHAGNRYSFLCPNYTLYDQTTFTCRYANTVDCKRSANHYSRNDALYKEKDKKEEPITTTLFPATTKPSDKKIKDKN